MALVIKDRISETTSTSGTGAITLGGATGGFQTFSTIGNTNTTYYCITDGSAWEVGIGTYSSSGNTLARTTVLSNSNGNTSPITLSGNLKPVFGVFPADGVVVVNGSTIQVPGSATLPITAGGTGSSTATFSGANITSLNASSISSGTLDNARTTASSSNGASTIVARGASGEFAAGTITATFSGDGSSVTSINGSNISSGTVANARTTASSSNGASTIVARGASGEFSAGTITATFSGSGASVTSINAANISTGVLAVARGGTNNAFFGVTGPATSEKTYTFPNENMSVGYRNLPAVGTKTGSYTLATGDVGKYVQVGSGGSITIPDATFAEGDAISIFNNTTGAITITCTITTAYIAGTDSDKASVSLATRGVATILFISSTVCVISGNVS